jgi:hypothetical protein
VVRESAMPKIVVVCPYTAKSISTGIETEPEVLSHLPNIQSTVQCPECGEMHFWSPADAFVADEAMKDRN